MLPVTRAVHRGQAEDGPRQRGVRLNDALDVNFLVILEMRRQRAASSVWEETFPEGSVLRERPRVWLSLLGSPEDPVRPVNVGARERDDPPGDAPECRHEAGGIPLADRRHGEDDVPRELRQLPRKKKYGRSGLHRMDVTHAERERRLVLSPVVDGDLMPQVGQPPDDGRSEKTRPADHEHAHSREHNGGTNPRGPEGSRSPP